MLYPKIRTGKDIDVKATLMINDEPADMLKVMDLKVCLKEETGIATPLIADIDYTQNPLSFSIKETCQYPAGKYRLTVSWRYNKKCTAYDLILFELVNHTWEENLKGCHCTCADVVVLDANMSITMGGEGRGIVKAEIIDKELFITYTDDEVINLGEVIGDPYKLALAHGLPDTVTEEEFYQYLAQTPNKVDAPSLTGAGASGDWNISSARITTFDCAGTNVKTVTIEGINSLPELTGKVIFLKMASTITSDNSITLNVNNLGSVGCGFFYNNSVDLQTTFPAYSLSAGKTYGFVYNGTYFVLADTIQYIDNAGSSAANVAASAASLTSLKTKLNNFYTPSLQKFVNITGDINLYNYFASQFPEIWLQNAHCLNMVFYNTAATGVNLVFPTNGTGGKTHLKQTAEVTLNSLEAIEISVIYNMDNDTCIWQYSDKLTQ